MTYPPGHEYGQQPGQGHGGYPQSGGFAAYGGQYGYQPGSEYGQAGQPQYGQAPYGQAPYGQPVYAQTPYGQPGYGRPPYGQPPQGGPGSGGSQQSGGKSGLVVGLSAGGFVVVALTIFFVTAFAVPGFLRDDSGQAVAGTTEPKLDRTDAVAVRDAFLNRINRGDAASAVALLCEPNLYGDDVREAVGGRARLVATDGSVYDDFASWSLTGTIAGKSVEGNLFAEIKSGTNFCITGISVR